MSAVDGADNTDLIVGLFWLLLLPGWKSARNL